MADTKYEGKLVRVNGEIWDIGIKTKLVILIPESETIKVRGHDYARAFCYFDSLEEEDMIALYKYKGQIVTIKGRISRYEQGFRLRIEDCEFQ